MEKLKRFYTSIVLAGYITLLFSLLATGNIRRFINPKLSYLSVLALLMLGGMFLASLRQNKKQDHHENHDHHCECCRHEAESFPKVNLILLLPLFLSMFVTAETISYQPSNTESGSLPEPKPAQTQISVPSGAPANWRLEIEKGESALVEYEEYTQLDIGNILFDKRQAFKDKLTGSNIYLQGLVVGFPELKAGEIVVYRMVISCCAADSLPLGVIVKLPEGSRFNDGEWIGVEGAVQLLPFKDEWKRIEPVAYMTPPERIAPYFIATKAYRMPKPEQLYLFP